MVIYKIFRSFYVYFIILFHYSFEISNCLENVFRTHLHQKIKIFQIQSFLSNGLPLSHGNVTCIKCQCFNIKYVTINLLTLILKHVWYCLILAFRKL